MSTRKLYFGLIGLLVLAGLAILFAASEANSLLVKQSQDLIQAKAKVAAVNKQQLSLAKDKKEIAKYSSLNIIAKTVVPQDKNQAEAVREIVNLAAESGISQLSSITFPASTLGGSTTAAKNALTQLTPVKGIPGIFALPITVTQSSNQSVSYSSFISFLSKLETNRRTAVISSISVQPDPLNQSNVSFTIVIEEYIKP